MDAAITRLIATAAKKTVQDPEKAFSWVAKVVIVVFIVTAIFLTMFTGLIGCFAGASLSDDFDPMDAAVYREVSKIYKNSMELLRGHLEQRKEELTEEYMDTVIETEPVWVEGHWKDVETDTEQENLQETEEVDQIRVINPRRLPTLEEENFGNNETPVSPSLEPDEGMTGGETEQKPSKEWVDGYWDTMPVEKQVCRARIDIQLNEMNLAYILAYLTVTEEDIWAQRTATVSAEKVNSFINYVMPMKEKKTDIPEEDQASAEGDEKYITTEILLYNDILPVYDVADHYFADDENVYEMFNLSFDLYLSFLGSEGLYADQGSGDFHVVYHEGGIEIPHYFQSDYSNVAYGNGTIASSGCALTCIAMVVSGLKNEEISPVDVLKFTGNKYYVPGSGSAWSIFDGCARHYGLTCRSLGKNLKAVQEALQSGKPVIASMAPGVFTGGGHFIVIRGMTQDGYFLVNDPNMSNYNKYGTDRFLTSTVLKEAKNFWSYE